MWRPRRWLLVGAMLVVLISGAGWEGGSASRAEAAYPGADGLRVASQQCLPGGAVRLNFAWTAYGTGPQWIDLSLSNNGFAPNTFVGLGSMPPSQNQFIWDGLIAGATHFVRINSLVGGQWIPSNTLGFFTMNCGLSQGPAMQGASNLGITSASCTNNGRVRMSASWTSSNNGEQWMDLSLANNGWVNGTFISLGPIPSGVTQQTWDGLLPNLPHYLRVNTGTSVGWIGSNTVFFTTPACAVNSGTPPTPVDDFTTVAKSVAATTNNQAVLTRVEFGAHPDEGYDRLVFTFDSGIPASTIQYSNQATSCGSGNAVPLQGVAVLKARFGSAVAHNNSGGVTVNATQVSGSSDGIVEAKQTCDFEGVVEWALGTDRIAPFKVSTLQNPPRIVVDVRR